MGNFEIFSGKDGKYYFRLKASNGQIILKSEGYKSKNSSLQGIDSVKINAQNLTRFERKQAKNGKYFFVLKASNGQIIGVSDFYSSEAARESAIASVLKNSQGEINPVQ